MRLITKNTDYGVRALLSLAASRGRWVSAREISSKLKIPYQFLRRVLNELIRAQLVISREGVKGGCRLAVPAGNIKVLEVIRIFQGDIRLSECMFRKRICQNRAACVLRKEIIRIEGVVQREFGQLSIGGLLKERDRP
jgi:Rrf2 family transcriptional regulator, cysteine metabolism repressor